jgi:NADH:ubiquinone oxidoreductase subunit C
MEAMRVDLLTESPEIYRKAKILEVAEIFRKHGITHFTRLFVATYPEYEGREADVRRVYQLRADDVEICEKLHELAQNINKAQA